MTPEGHPAVTRNFSAAPVLSSAQVLHVLGLSVIHTLP